MPSNEELQARLDKVRKLRRIKELQAQIGEQQKAYEESRTLKGRTSADFKGMLAGLTGMAATGMSYGKIVGQSIDQDVQSDVQRRSAGLPTETNAKKILNQVVGPMLSDALQMGLSAPSSIPMMIPMAESTAKTVIERPISGGLEAIGMLQAPSIARSISRAVIARRPPPMRFLGWDGPIPGEGFIMGKTPSMTEDALTRYRPGVITPSTPLKALPAPEPMKLLEGPMVGPQGEGQFVARKGPPTVFETRQAEMLAKRQAIRAALDAAQSDPTKAAAAFKKLADDMAGGRLSRPGEGAFKMGAGAPPIEAVISTTKKGTTIKAPTVSPQAVEIRNTPIQTTGKLGAPETKPVLNQAVSIIEPMTGETLYATQRTRELMTRSAFLSEQAVKRFKGIRSVKRVSTQVRKEPRP